MTSGKQAGVADRIVQREVRGWGEAKAARSGVFSAASAEDCARLLEYARAEGKTVCPRGAGCSFGDQALNGGQLVLDTTRMDRILSWDPGKGMLTAEPGVTMAQVLKKTLKENWALGACVGTPAVTVAGAVANNVHGKDSFKTGNFVEQVDSLKLMTSSGEVRTLSREREPELFKAVVGGMGLLGVVVEATLRCRRVPSPYVEITTIPKPTVRESLEELQRRRDESDFMVTWVDAFRTDPSLGGGFVKVGRWVEGPKGDPSAEIDRLLEPSTLIFGKLPMAPTWWMLSHFYGPTFVRCANWARYHLYRRGGVRKQTMLYPAMNFLHNLIPELNRVFRPHGFLEYQPLLPMEAGIGAVEDILRFCQERGTQSLLCGMKIHPADDCLLSYSGSGFSLGIDVHQRGWKRSELEGFARELFTRTIELGGLAYLAKDEMMPRDIFRKMYPRAEEFARVKKRLDPDGLFASDMSRRILG